MAIQEEDQKMGSSSDDDTETVPGKVENYWLEDAQENPISLSSLPFLPEEGNDEDQQQQSIFLRGTTDGGLQRVYVKAEAWKIDFSQDNSPVFLIRARSKHWIEVLKPRKSYEEIIRSLIVVAQFLDFIQQNPDATEKNVWNHLTEIFRSYEIQPSSSDLAPHANVIDYYIRLKGLGSLETLSNIILQSSRKKAVDTTVSELLESGEDHNFDDSVDLEEAAEGFSGEEDFEEIGDLSEPVCAICDNGGDVLCCEGPCMRSFHLNKGADGAEDSSCATLGFSKKEVETMEKYFCPNCQYKQHQCFACGELGCSDDSLGPAQEVFICDVAICGRFYHPICVAKLLCSGDESGETALAQGIVEGQGFSCPIHKCLKCAKGEVAEEEDLQFALCRRCPRAWHRKCLPSSISFEEIDDEPERAWDGLLSNNRILVYCKRHKINPDLGTPRRDHLKFPKTRVSKLSGVTKKKPDLEVKKRKIDDDTKVKEIVQAKKSKIDTQATKSKSDLDSIMPRSKLDLDNQSVKSKPELGRSDSQIKSGKSEVSAVPQICSKDKPKRDSDTKMKTISAAPLKVVKIEKDTTPKDSPLPKTVSQTVDAPFKKKEKLLARSSIFSVNDTEIRSSIDAIIKKSRESTTLESIIERHNMPRCYQRSHKSADKKYSLTKIESIIKAMRRAVETMDKGGSIEDAKTKCSATFVKFLDVCRNELKVYLAPFLHGMRYTSFGRHFTKYDKLQEVVSRLQWYVQDGDMIVDMCCGANDFSILMRDQMKRIRRNCEFLNFDIILPKNDFNFIKRDWFQVKADELANGSRLIIGLNPPFGLKGGLANSFIDQALKFKPKLVILIVPKETERLDRKSDKYTLIWEDQDLLKGESFYLPGSVDVDKNPLNDWNVVAPPLYLWSRPDWVQRHQEIALQQGHIKSISDPMPRYAGVPWMGRPLAPDPVSISDSKQESWLSQINDMDKFNMEQIGAPYEPTRPAAEPTGKLDAVGMVIEATTQQDDVTASRKVNVPKDAGEKPTDVMRGDANRMRNSERNGMRKFEKNMTGKGRKKNVKNDKESQSRGHQESKYDGSKISNEMENKHTIPKSGDQQNSKGHDKGKNLNISSSNTQKGRSQRFADVDRHKDLDDKEWRDIKGRHDARDMHNTKDRHDTRDRIGRHEETERRGSRGRYDDQEMHYLSRRDNRDKSERYEAQVPYYEHEKQSDRRTSPDRYGRKPESLQSSHVGRGMQRKVNQRTTGRNDAKSRQRSSKLFQADQALEMAKSGSSAEMYYPEVTMPDKVDPHEDESKKRPFDLDADGRTAHFHRDNRKSDQGSIVKGGHLDDIYISKELEKSDTYLPDAFAEDSRRREITDTTFGFDKIFDSVDEEVRNKLDPFVDLKRREFIDSDVQRREPLYPSRDYSEQVTLNNYERHYSDRDFYNTRAVDSQACQKLAPSQSGILEPYDRNINIHQNVTDYRYLNLQSEREQGRGNYDDSRTQHNLDFENSHLRSSYNTSDLVASIHERNLSSNWLHEPYNSRQPGEFHSTVASAGPMPSSWAKSTPSMQYSGSNIDSLLDSVLGPRRDINLPSHTPYTGGGRYGESQPFFPR